MDFQLLTKTHLRIFKIIGISFFNYFSISQKILWIFSCLTLIFDVALGSHFVYFNMVIDYKTIEICMNVSAAIFILVKMFSITYYKRKLEVVIHKMQIMFQSGNYILNMKIKFWKHSVFSYKRRNWNFTKV